MIFFFFPLLFLALDVELLKLHNMYGIMDILASVPQHTWCGCFMSQELPVYGALIPGAGLLIVIATSVRGMFPLYLSSFYL